MSDVSGIPYMGPQGVGNLYAPLFPASGMSTPSAAQISYNWAPEGNYSQNVTNNLFSSGGGFGKQTDYYSQLGANYSAAGMSPYGIFSEGGGNQSPFSYGGYGTSNQGGGYTAPSVNDTSIDWTHLFSGGGGGGGGFSTLPSYNASDLSSGIFGGLGGSAGAYQGPGNQINWSNLFGGGGGGGGSSFTPSANNYDTFQSGWGNVSNTMPQGGAYQGMAKPIDWSNWSGGGETPQPQQQPTDFGSLFGQGVGGNTTEPYPPENTVADPNRATYGGYGQGGATSALPDYMTNNQLPADLRPSAPPEPGSRTYDFAPMFEGGGGGGIGTGGTTSQLFGANNSGSLGGDPFSYNPYASEAQDNKSTAAQPADALAAQARARLADLISGAPDKATEETAKTVEQPAETPDQTVPLPQARPEAADVARPPAAVPQFPAARLAPNGKEPEAFIVHHTGDRHDPALTADIWRSERPGVGTQYIMDRNGVIHDTLNEYGYGGTGHIYPPVSGTNSGIPGAQGLSNANVVGMEITANNDADMTPAQIAALKQFAAQNYPDTPFYGHSEVSSNRENEGIRGSQDILQERPPLFNFDWSNAPIPDPLNPNAPRPPGDIPTPENIPLPAARPADAPAAVKAGPTGVEKAQTFLNRPVESILQQYSPGSLTAAGFAMDVKQPLREALKGPFGSQILEGLQTRAGELGLTKSDFNKAIADPKARSDLGPETPGMADWLGNIGKYAGNPFVSSASAEPFTGSKAQPTPAEQQGMDALERLQTNIRAREEGRQPDLSTGPRIDQPKSLLPEETGLPDLPFSAAPSRFGDAVFGTYTGPEDHSGGYPEFRRQDASIDDRRGEPEPSAGLFNTWADKALNKGQDIVDNIWRTYGPREDPGELGRALGYDDIMTTPLPPVTPEMVAMLNKSQAVQRGPDLPQPFGGFEPSRLGEGGADNAFTPREPSGASFDERFGAMGDRGALAGSMANFQSPANDYSMFQAGTRDLSNPVDAAIAESAPATGLDFAHWKAIADIESSLNPTLNQNADTQYKGLYQLGSKASDPEWATHGMGDIYNATDNALAASRLFQYNAERFKNVYGRDPTPGEAYVLHNQGLGFFTKNLAPAGENVPAGHGFTVPATHDTFLTDWNRYLEEKAARYR